MIVMTKAKARKRSNRHVAKPHIACKAQSDESAAIGAIALDPSVPLHFVIWEASASSMKETAARVSNFTIGGSVTPELVWWHTNHPDDNSSVITPGVVGKATPGGSAAIHGLTPDPSEPLASSVGAPEVIVNRAVVDEIIKRHSNAGLTDDAAINGQLQSAYMLGISPAHIEQLGACAAVLYGLIPPRVTTNASKDDRSLEEIKREPTSPDLTRQQMKQAVDIQLAIVGSVLGRRPDLGWLFMTLVSLSDGLLQLERGFSPPALIRRRRTAKEPRETTYQKLVKALSVLAWAALVRIGVKKGDAARMIAKHLTNGKFLAENPEDQKSTVARSILNWVKRYEFGYLPPLVRVSVEFSKRFTCDCKTDPKRVLELFTKELIGLREIFSSGASVRILEPAARRT